MQRVEQHLGLVLVGADVVADLDHPQVAALDRLADADPLRAQLRVQRREVVEDRQHLGQRVVTAHRALPDRRRQRVRRQHRARGERRGVGRDEVGLEHAAAEPRGLQALQVAGHRHDLDAALGRQRQRAAGEIEIHRHDDDAQGEDPQRARLSEAWHPLLRHHDAAARPRRIPRRDQRAQRAVRRQGDRPRGGHGEPGHDSPIRPPCAHSRPASAAEARPRPPAALRRRDDCCRRLDDDVAPTSRRSALRDRRVRNVSSDGRVPCDLRTRASARKLPPVSGSLIAPRSPSRRYRERSTAALSARIKKALSGSPCTHAPRRGSCSRSLPPCPRNRSRRTGLRDRLS